MLFVTGVAIRVTIEGHYPREQRLLQPLLAAQIGLDPEPTGVREHILREVECSFDIDLVLSSLQMPKLGKSNLLIEVMPLFLGGVFVDQPCKQTLRPSGFFGASVQHIRNEGWSLLIESASVEVNGSPFLAT
jgi:hypothetical protein